VAVDVALGVLHHEYLDVAIPGTITLTWERRYTTALARRAPTPLGIGWTCEYFATLTRTGNGFELSIGSDVVTFDNGGGVASGGHVARNLAACAELFSAGSHWIVQTWNVETSEVRRLRFAQMDDGVPSPLIGVEDPAGRALDLRRDPQGRLGSITQRVEGRQLRLVYSIAGLIERVELVSRRGNVSPIARYEYDVRQRLVSAYDAQEACDRFEYDELSRMTRVIGRDTGIFSFRYDSTGRCVMASGLNRYDEKRLTYLEAARITEVRDSHDQI